MRPHCQHTNHANLHSQKKFHLNGVKFTPRAHHYLVPCEWGKNNPTQTSPFPWAGSGPPPNTWLVAPPKSSSQTTIPHVDRVSRLSAAHRSAYTLKWHETCHHKTAPSPSGDWTPPPPNTWFLESNQVHNPNSISISSILYGSQMCSSDRQTDHATLIATGHVVALCACDPA